MNPFLLAVVENTFMNIFKQQILFTLVSDNFVKSLHGRHFSNAFLTYVAENVLSRHHLEKPSFRFLISIDISDYVSRKFLFTTEILTKHNYPR